MPKVNHRQGVHLQLLDGATSTGAYGDYTLATPASNFALEAAGNSSTFKVQLQGTLQSSSGPDWTLLAEYASSDVTSGQIIAPGTSVAGIPIRRLRGVLEAGASSGGISAWVTATI